MRFLHRPYLNCLSEKISGSRNHEAHEDHEDGSCHEDVCRWSTKITKKAADGSPWGPALRPFGIFVIFVTFVVRPFIGECCPRSIHLRDHVVVEHGSAAAAERARELPSDYAP